MWLPIFILSSISVLLVLISSPRAGGIAVALENSLPHSEEVSVLLLGDMQFDRRIREISTAKGADYIFSCVDPLLSSAQIVVANLEGPITDAPSVSVGSIVGSADNFVFTFPTSTAGLLFRHNITAVNIGNNHISNFGYAGVESTHAYLDNAGVEYFGGIQGDESVFRTIVGSTTFSFIGYNEFGGDSPQLVAQKIAQEHAQGRIVVVYAHWGDEYIDSSSRLRPVATFFAHSGANAVIGSHPHVALGHEYIGKTLVYYSLGNFIFDQYWESDVREGVAVKLVFSTQGLVGVDEYALDIGRDGRTCPRMHI
jgi:poly-gamma-glutamate synthesis protein (capsule biosynthesis protein)